MRYWLFLFSLLFLNLSLKAHEANEAFFVVKQQGNKTIVESEFPWTMRNALLAFDPALENATDKAAFERVFERYIQAHLILLDSEGHPLNFLGFQEMETSGHAHQSNYVLTFEDGDLAEIRNSLMFDLYEHQVNYVLLRIGDQERTFQTTRNAPSFQVDVKQKEFNYFYFLLILIPLTFGILFLRKKSLN